MISFFRRALSSWIVLGLLALIMIAFIITGVNSPGSIGGVTDSGSVAKAGDRKISATELTRRVQNQLQNARRQTPTLDAKSFVDSGGFDQVTEALISARAIDSWGARQRFAIGKRLVDAEIAGIPAFKGVTGQFDEATMRSLLAQQRISEKDLRADIASDLLRGQIMFPTTAGVPAAAKLATPYAKLLLEQRSGQVGVVPLAAVAVTAQPSDAEIAAAYKANIASYTQAETRVLRYALFGAAKVAAAAQPTEAEIAAYYKENGAAYAAKQTRDLTQLILPTQAAAQAIATKVGAGTALGAAAAQAGLEASTLTKQSQADYANAANAAIASTVFAAKPGELVGPVKGAFGWYVIRIDSVGGTPARTLDQARTEIVTTLAAQKAANALADLASKIEGQVTDGAGFDEIVKSNGLTLVTTPPILATGQAPGNPDWKPAPELTPLLKPGFDATPDDDPTVETVIKDKDYALLGVASVIPPTPIPLAKVRDAVARDLMVKRTRARAQAIAQAIAAKVGKGMKLADALAGAGVKLPPPAPASARQIDLARAQDPRQIPAPLRLIFAMKPGQAKVVAADNGGAIFVVVLEKVVPGDLAQAPGLVETTRTELVRATIAETTEQFVRAVEKDIGTSRNDAAIAAARRQFANGGQGSDGQ
jgi:peptidyl-prolyl cis-trans isomerase D